MPDLNEITMDFGFITSDIFSRSLFLIHEEEYSSIAKCSSLEEIVMRLNKFYPNLNEEIKMDIFEIEDKIVSLLQYEVSEFDAVGFFPVLYFVEFHKIESLFHSMQKAFSQQKSQNNKEKELGRFSLGVFPEISNLKYCKSLRDIENLVLKYSGLEKYFLDIKIPNEVENIDFKSLYFHVMKNFYEFSYDFCLKSRLDHFLKIVKTEMDCFVLDMCVDLSLKDRSGKYVPKYYTCKNLDGLRSNFEASFPNRQISTRNEPKEDIKAIENLVLNQREKQNRAYKESFNIFGDISSIYSYFKLKENEMKKILYIIEGTLNKD